MNGDGIVGDLAVGLANYAGDGFGAYLYYGPISGTIAPASVSANITNVSDGDGVGFDLWESEIKTATATTTWSSPGMNKGSHAGGVYVVLGPVTHTSGGRGCRATIAGAVSDGVGWYPSAGDERRWDRRPDGGCAGHRCKTGVAHFLRPSRRAT